MMHYNTLFFMRTGEVSYKLSFYFEILLKESLPETVGVSAKVLVERSTQIYRLPTDPNLFK